MLMQCPNGDHRTPDSVVINCTPGTSILCLHCLRTFRLLDYGEIINNERDLCRDCTKFLERARTIVGRTR